MKTFVLALVIGSLSSISQARPVFALKCTPKARCAYSSSADLGYCVQKLAVYGSQGSSEGSLIITPSPANPASEILLSPIEIHVNVTKRGTTLTFRDAEGENWGKLNGNIQAEGTITLDEDFEFEVTCYDESIGYE